MNTLRRGNCFECGSPIVLKFSTKTRNIKYDESISRPNHTLSHSAFSMKNVCYVIISMFIVLHFVRVAYQLNLSNLKVKLINLVESNWHLKLTHYYYCYHFIHSRQIQTKQFKSKCIVHRTLKIKSKLLKYVTQKMEDPTYYIDNC